MKNIFENLISKAIWAALFPLALTGCQAERQLSDEWNGNDIRMRFAATQLSGGTTSGDDARIGSLTGFRITGNTVVEVLHNLNVDENGWCILKPSEKKGTVYFVANGSGVESLAEASTLDELLALELSGSEMTSEGVAMTGKIDLSQTGNTEVGMKRSVARIDIDARSAGVEIKEIVIGNVADKGILWNENTTPVSSESAHKTDRRFSYEPTISKEKQTVCYIYEQINENLTVLIKADVEGTEYELGTKLPADIRRNTVYTLKVNGTGGKLDVDVQEADWEGTDEVNAGEEKLEFTVDVMASELPTGVTVNERMDEINVPYTYTEFDLVMNTIAGTSLKISGAVDGVDVKEVIASRVSGNQLVVHIKSASKTFTDLGGSIQLQAVNAEGVSVGEIMLNFEANPCRLTGDLVFDENNHCRFSKYIEGELAVLFLPEGMNAELRFDTSENENGKEWMKMEERIDGSFRLLAGWCENYKKDMNGRTEAAQLVITDSQGTEAVYTITRPYRSIPTVKVDGKYWSMFPMVGNSKNLEEQIDMEIAPNDLMEYLMTCSDEEFIRLQGSHYQGGIPQAVTIHYDETKQAFAYEGFTEAALAMNTVKDEDMLPEGWRLPTQDDLAGLSWGVGVWTYYYKDRNITIGGKTYYVRERDNIAVDGQNYGKAYVWSIQKSSERLIFSGFRTQQNINGISSHTSFIPAATGSSNTPWELCIDGNTFGFVRYHGYPAISTYTMHSIKIAPEYIYQ